MSDPQPLIQDQAITDAKGENRHSRRRHRHSLGKRLARGLKKYRTPILVVAGILLLLIVWYLIATYEPKSPLM
jgi:hypothetical protein